MPDGGRTQRPAAVLTAAVVATMLDGGAVLDKGLPGAVVPAPAQLRIERVEDVHIQRADLNLAQERRDVQASTIRVTNGVTQID